MKGLNGRASFGADRSTFVVLLEERNKGRLKLVKKNNETIKFPYVVDVILVVGLNSLNLP